MIAKLVKSKHASGEPDEVNEVEEVDRTLHSLSRKQLDVHPKAFPKQLEFGNSHPSA